MRTPRRTLMTTLGIGAVVTIVVALAGVMDSFDQTLAASRQEALAGAPDRMIVGVDPMDGFERAEVKDAGGLELYSVEEVWALVRVAGSLTTRPSS